MAGKVYAVEIPIGHTVEVDATGSTSRTGHGLTSGLVSAGLRVWGCAGPPCAWPHRRRGRHRWLEGRRRG
jgi:hypothetical protein